MKKSKDEQNGGRTFFSALINPFLRKTLSKQYRSSNINTQKYRNRSEISWSILCSLHCDSWQFLLRNKAVEYSPEPAERTFLFLADMNEIYSNEENKNNWFEEINASPGFSDLKIRKIRKSKNRCFSRFFARHFADFENWRHFRQNWNRLFIEIGSHLPTGVRKKSLSNIGYIGQKHWKG